MASALSSSLLSSHPTRPSLSSKTITLNPFLISKPIRPPYLIASPSRRARAALTVDSPAADRREVKEENPEVLPEVKDLKSVIAESRQEILRGVNLTVREGEIHAIMGKNGSGKSTLSNVLVGHPDYEVTRGTTVFKGEDLLDMEPEERSHAGTFMSFQTPVEIPGVSNIDFLRMAYNAQRKKNGQPEMSPIEVAVEQSLKDQNMQISEDMDAVKSGPSILKDNVKKITDSVASDQPKAFKKERNTKKICSSPRSKLDSYQILKYPLFTESAMKNITENNTLVFIVNIRADKKNIREAVETMCNVQTKKINTLITPNGTKKAFVALPVEYNAVDVAKKMFNI